MERGIVTILVWTGMVLAISVNMEGGGDSVLGVTRDNEWMIWRESVDYHYFLSLRRGGSEFCRDWGIVG
jgi:hypothetical protein